MKQTITKVLTISPKARKYILVAVVLIVVLFLGIKLFTPKNNSKQATLGVSTPQKSETINKDFTFPVTDTISMKFTVVDASLNNQIVVQGVNATAVAGRTFLIISLKISNSFNQAIKINTRDYIRLSVNGDENTWLAPDIHNDGTDGVEVQAISTKFTRVGFPVNVTDKNFILQIGEIKGNKQKINLSL